MSLHIALHIMLKGVLPLSALGGGIGGLVYQFSPSDSRTDLEKLEDALKDIDSPIGNSEYLKEKVKELSVSLNQNKEAIESLNKDLIAAKETKEKINREIKEKQEKVKSLDFEKEKQQTLKETKEKEKVEVDKKNSEALNKYRADKQKLEAQNKRIEGIEKEKKALEQVKEKLAKDLTEQTETFKLRTQEYEEEHNYSQLLVNYEYYMQCGYWWHCWSTSSGIKEEHLVLRDDAFSALVISQNNDRAAKFFAQTTSKDILDKTKVLIKTNNEEISKKDTALNTEKSKLPPLQTASEATQKAYEDINKQLTSITDAIKKADEEIVKANKEKEQLLIDISSSPSLLESTESLIETKTSELEKHQSDYNRLSALAQKIINNNPVDLEIIESLTTALTLKT